MRIAVLLSSHSCLDDRVVVKEAASLARMGHEVVVIAPDLPGDQAIDGIQYVSLQNPKLGLLARAQRLPALLRQAIRCDADVYSCHEPESALIGLIARAKTGAPVVFDVHEFYEDTLAVRIGGWRKPIIAWMATRMMRMLGRRSDWITAVCEPLADLYRSLRNDRRVDIIYNSPIVESFPLCDQSDRDELLVCHDGMIALDRGALEMLDALAIARDEIPIRLQFVGTLADDCRELFHRKVESLGLSDVVDVSGWLEYSKVGARLSAGQVGTVALQPVRSNSRLGLPNKLFNYMCCGMACVAPADTATADLVREANCGLVVDVTNPREIADAWVRLARDGDLRRRLGRNGRAAVEQKYGWHVMEDVLERVYTQVLAGKQV